MSGWLRLIGAALLAVGGLRLSRQRPRRRRPAGEAGLALVLDVWAMALRAGCPVVDAVAAAAAVAPGPAAAALAQVVAAQRSGVGASQAWSAVELPPALRAAGNAATRSEADGIALEPVLARLAATERAERLSEGLAAARRAAVWSVLPLGLCYLPAYVLLGVVPAVVGVIGGHGLTGAST